jgi:hypothetical protein
MHLLPTKAQLSLIRNIVVAAVVRSEYDCFFILALKFVHEISEPFQIETPHIFVGFIVYVMASVNIEFVLVNKRALICSTLWPQVVKTQFAPILVGAPLILATL